MAAVELILLQRVENLGQMGDLVKVKPGYARNYLLPQKKALRASKENLARFEEQRTQLEAQNLKRREEAERVAEWIEPLAELRVIHPEPPVHDEARQALAHLEVEELRAVDVRGGHQLRAASSASPIVA